MIERFQSLKKRAIRLQRRDEHHSTLQPSEGEVAIPSIRKWWFHFTVRETCCVATQRRTLKCSSPVLTLCASKEGLQRM